MPTDPPPGLIAVSLTNGCLPSQHPLPVVRQCQLLALARSPVYYTPPPVPAGDLALMRQLDELHLAHPFAGSRMPRDLLRLRGVGVGRTHVATLMRRMGIAALYRHPRTTQPHPGTGYSRTSCATWRSRPRTRPGSRI